MDTPESIAACIAPFTPPRHAPGDQGAEDEATRHSSYARALQQGTLEAYARNLRARAWETERKAQLENAAVEEAERQQMEEIEDTLRDEPTGGYAPPEWYGPDYVADGRESEDESMPPFGGSTSSSEDGRPTRQGEPEQEPITREEKKCVCCDCRNDAVPWTCAGRYCAHCGGQECQRYCPEGKQVVATDSVYCEIGAWELMCMCDCAGCRRGTTTKVSASTLLGEQDEEMQEFVRQVNTAASSHERGQLACVPPLTGKESLREIVEVIR